MFPFITGKTTKEYLLRLLGLDIRDEVMGTSFPQNVQNKIFDSTNIFPFTIPPALLTGLSTTVKPTVGISNYTEFLETDTLEKYVIINGIWHNLSSVSRQQLIPDLNFIQNRVITSGGLADFIHWIEPIMKSNKIVVPFSFLSVSVSGGIAISDDGINTREVFRSVKANENFWLTAKDRGDLCLVGSGSGGANIVGSVYRTQDLGETWTEILSNTDIRVYGIEYSLPTKNAIVVTSAGSVPNTAGKILRSTNISIGSPTFSTIVTLSEGARCVKTVQGTGTILVGTGHSNGGGIFRSADEGSSFTKIKTFTNIEGENVYWIQDYYDSKTNVTKIFAFMSNGKVFVSTNDGVAWTQLASYYSYTAAPTRRIVQYNDMLLAANDIQGLSIFDPVRGILNPVNTDLQHNSSAIPFYSIIKHRGSLIASVAYNLLYAGKIQPCEFTLWSNKAVSTGGLDTAPFSKIGHGSLSSSAIIYSDQGGTVTVQILDTTLAVPLWRNVGTVTVVAATAKTINFVDYVRGANFWRLNFVPSLAANVDLWVVLD